MSHFCAECGLTREEHHDFAAIETPKGCACDAMDWRNPNDIPAVCGSLLLDSDGLCKTCQHLSECHRPV